MIIINNGDLYILDCTKMVLLNYEDGEALQGKMIEYSSVDLNKNGKLLSVSENGHGRLATVERNP